MSNAFLTVLSLVLNKASSSTFRDIFFFSATKVSSINLLLSIKVSCSSFDTNVLLVGDFWSSQHAALKFLATKTSINHSKLESQGSRKCQSHTPIMEPFMKLAYICSPGTHRVQVSPSQNHIPPHSIRRGMSNFFLYLQMWECRVLIYCGPEEIFQLHPFSTNHDGAHSDVHAATPLRPVLHSPVEYPSSKVNAFLLVFITSQQDSPSLRNHWDLWFPVQ